MFDIDKLKGMIPDEKKTIIIYAVLFIAVAALSWYLFSGRDINGRAEQVRDNIQSVGDQQQRAGQEVRESQRIVTEIRETNTIIKREIDDSRAINQSSSELIREGKRIFQTVREREQIRTK